MKMKATGNQSGTAHHIGPDKPFHRPPSDLRPQTSVLPPRSQTKSSLVNRGCPSLQSTGDRARPGRCETRPRGSPLRSNYTQCLVPSHAAEVRREAHRTAVPIDFGTALPRNLLVVRKLPRKKMTEGIHFSLAGLWTLNNNPENKLCIQLSRSHIRRKLFHPIRGGYTRSQFQQKRSGAQTSAASYVL